MLMLSLSLFGLTACQGEGSGTTDNKLGYTNVKEFGGIIDWPYEIVK